MDYEENTRATHYRRETYRNGLGKGHYTNLNTLFLNTTVGIHKVWDRFFTSVLHHSHPFSLIEFSVC